jgi:hypothetical protein
MRFKLFDANNELQYVVDGPNEPMVRAWLYQEVDDDVVQVVLQTNPDVESMPGPWRIERSA